METPPLMSAAAATFDLSEASPVGPPPVVADSRGPIASPSPLALAGFWGERLDREADVVPWLWEGYVAPGQVTLLTSQWKTGKTTLLSVLLSRFKEGGNLADLAVTAARPVVVSEEPEALWRPRHQRLDLRHVYFLCRPFAGKPTMEQWLGLLDHVAELRRRHGFALLAIDTISSFFPGGSENNADAAMKALMPLQRLTADGMAVWLQHHPKKGPSLPGQAARGTGAFGGFADIVLEMYRCARGNAQGSAQGDDDRRRRLIAFSRSERTPSQLVLELNAAGTDYCRMEDVEGDAFAANWQQLRMVLEDADDKLTRREILVQWPADYPRPKDHTLWQWLTRAANLGLLVQQGSGRRNDPFRYWLAAKEAEWKSDPLYVLREIAEIDIRKVLEGHNRRK